MLLPVVYREGTFKMAPLALWNPQGEMTPEIWYNPHKVDTIRLVFSTTRHYVIVRKAQKPMTLLTAISAVQAYI